MDLHVRLNDERDAELIALLEDYEGGKTKCIKAALTLLRDIESGEVVLDSETSGGGDYNGIIRALCDINQTLSHLKIAAPNGGEPADDEKAKLEEEMRAKLRKLGRV